MLIDKFIELSKQMDNQRHGGNKKCFLFDEYALLYGGFNREYLEKEIRIINKLKNDGVAVIPPVEYKIDDTSKNKWGFSTGYCLQERAKGSELYSPKMPVEDYENRLKEISQMTFENFDKFVSDWIAINNAGISVDPSKCGNFFFSDGKISFIDLNFIDKYKKERMKSLFNESYIVLTGAGLKFKHDKERRKETKYYDYIRIIFNKLLDAFMKKRIPTDFLFKKVVEECYTDSAVIEELLEKNKKYNQSLQFNEGVNNILDINKIDTSDISLKKFEKINIDR